MSERAMNEHATCERANGQVDGRANGRPAGQAASQAAGRPAPQADAQARPAAEQCAHTDAALTVDPLNPCCPVGMMYAAFGVHGGLPLSHGASGCCRFQRMELAKHFQKTVHVPSSMLRDRAAAFGGEPELVEAVGNVFRLYDPQVLVVGSTCLSETMGDDLDGMVRRLDVPAGKRVVWASTPGYAGSHLKGYGATVAALIRQLAGGAPAGFRASAERPAAGLGGDSGAPAGRRPDAIRLCLVPGWMNPCDVDAATGYARAFFDRVTVLPDVRGVFDVRSPGNPALYPAGGTPLADIEELGGCDAALTLGFDATHEPAGALRALLGEQGGPDARGCVREGLLPVGISATDAFIGALVELSGRPAPAWIVDEHQRLIDCLAQVAPNLYGRRVLICCDADLACALAAFACDAGMVPIVAVGDTEPGFERRVRAATGRTAAAGRPVSTGAGVGAEVEVLAGVDRLTVEERLRALAAEGRGADIVLGDTRNKRLAARLGVPLVRVGFPVVDRPLAYTQPVAGYRGALDLIRRIAEAFADQAEAGVAPEDLAIHKYF